MKVLLTAPLRQDPKIFVEYQKALDALIIPESVTVDRYFVVNDCPEVIPYINGSYDVINTEDEYIKTKDDHIWTDENLDKMSKLRNCTIEKAKSYDYWFSVDTDLILQPETLKVLLEADKDIVSEVFWSKAPNGEWWCNAWMYDIYDPDGQLPKWREPGLYKVGMTGACTLAKTKVFNENVNYSKIPNLKIWGEDRWFCIRAAVEGYEMWLDTHYPALHLYTEDIYNEYVKNVHIFN